MTMCGTPNFIRYDLHSNTYIMVFIQTFANTSIINVNEVMQIPNYTLRLKTQNIIFRLVPRLPLGPRTALKPTSGAWAACSTRCWSVTRHSTRPGSDQRSQRFVCQNQCGKKRTRNLKNNSIQPDLLMLQNIFKTSFAIGVLLKH